MNGAEGELDHVEDQLGIGLLLRVIEPRIFYYLTLLSGGSASPVMPPLPPVRSRLVGGQHH